MILEDSIEKSLARVPCFACSMCYSCRYWRHPIWRDWILKNPSCPAQTFTFDSIFVALEMEAKRKADISSSYMANSNGILESLFPPNNAW